MSRFIDQIELISQIVIDQLGLQQFSRMGVRAWYLFRCENKEESERWAKQLGIFTISEKLITAFGEQAESAGFSVIIPGTDRKYRIEVNGVEKGAQLDRGSEIVNINPRALPKNQDKILREKLRQTGRLRAMPTHAVLIDIDAFQEDPISVNPREFTRTSVDGFLKQLSAAMPGP